jgi:hypothetical protein
MTSDKKKINVKEHMSENLIDLSLTGISEVPVKDIVRESWLFNLSKKLNDKWMFRIFHL